MLLEREGELAAFDRALRDAGSAAGSAWLISGARGTGKSALLQEFSRAAIATHGARVLRAHGAPAERKFAFGIIRQLLEPLLTDAPGEVRERWLGGTAGLARPVFVEGGEPYGESVFAGLSALIGNLCAERVVVFAVDGLQWVDVESLRLLENLANRLDTSRLVLAGTVGVDGARSCDVLRQGFAGVPMRTLRPAGLSLGGARILASAHYGEVCDERFAAACHEACDGNPALLVKAVSELAAAGIRPVAENAATAREQAHAMLLEQRLAWLGEEPRAARDFASAMVVLGEQGEQDLLCQLAGVAPAERAEVMLSLGGLVVEGRRPRFVHSTLARGVADSLTIDEHDRLHRNAALLLHENGYPAEQVAEQVVVISSALDQWGTSVLREGAAAGSRRGAPDSATRYLRRALADSPDDGEDRARLLVELAAAERAFDPPSSLRHLCQATGSLATDTDRAAAAALIPPASTTVDRVAARLVAETAAALGDPCLLTGPVRETAVRLAARKRYAALENPIELATSGALLRGYGLDLPLDTGADRELAVVLLVAATLTGELPSAGLAALGRRILEREPASWAHVHTALPLLVTVLTAADSAGDVSGWLDLALTQAQRHHAVAAESQIQAERAVLFLSNGQIPAARAGAIRAFELADPRWPEATVTASVALASVALETRDTALAARVLASGPAEADLRIGVLHGMLRGSLAAARDEPNVALEHILGCGRRLDQAGWRNPAVYRWRAWAATLQHRLGNAGEAEKLAEEEHSLAQAWGAPATVGRALRVWGSVTDGERSVVLLRDAVDMLERSADRLELARTLVLLGRRRLAIGDLTGAEQVQRGQEEAKACGATWLAEDGAGADPGARQGGRHPGGRTALTRSEARVADLAVRGQSNQEIAGRLGVSRRAVEKHLTNAYRKLGVDGRAGLAGALGPADDG